MVLRATAAGGLMLLVALAPLPLGANRDWSWGPLAAFTGALLVLQAMTAPTAKRPYPFFGSLVVPLGLVALVCLWILVQALGLAPPEWENPIRKAAQEALPGEFHPAIVALEQDQALTGLMRLLTYVGVFLLAADLGSSYRTTRTLYGIVVCSAVAYTLYAMAASVANRTTIATGISLFVPQEGIFSFPFINRNNYATYAGVAALAAVAMATSSLLAPSYGSGGESTAERWRRRLGAISGVGGLWLAAAAILIVGVLLSGSRAGWASMMMGIVATLAIMVHARSRWWIIIGVLLALLVLVALMPGGNVLLTRAVALADAGDSGREALFDLTVHAIGLRPWTGWGANSFQSLFSVFQSSTMRDFFDKAHNTYLELAFDLGIPAAAGLILAVAWIPGRCLLGSQERRQHRELCALGVGASVLAGFHALFDFSLQIPGFAVVFAAILGAAWAQSWSTRRLAS